MSGLLVALLCGGHVLMEGVPGTAKTLLVRTLAASLSVETTRVQFTPDLMPGDITGSMVIDSHPGRAALPRGAGLHQPAARRRDQPDAAEDPVGAARGDGGGPGLGRRGLATAAQAVPGRRHPEPRRVRRHLSPAGSAAGPVPAQGDPADPRPARRDGDPAPARCRLRPAGRGRGRGDRGRRRGRHRGRAAGGQDRAGLAGGRRLHRRHRPGHPRVAVAVARREPAWRHLAAPGGPGVGVAERPRLRHSRRREVAGPRVARAPARAAPGGRARGRRRRQVLSSALGSVPVPR